MKQKWWQKTINYIKKHNMVPQVIIGISILILASIGSFIYGLINLPIFRQNLLGSFTYEFNIQVWSLTLLVSLYFTIRHLIIARKNKNTVLPKNELTESEKSILSLFIFLKKEKLSYSLIKEYMSELYKESELAIKDVLNQLISRYILSKREDGLGVIYYKLREYGIRKVEELEKDELFKKTYLQNIGNYLNKT